MSNKFLLVEGCAATLNPSRSHPRTLLIIAGNDLRGDDGAARAALSLLRPRLLHALTVWEHPSCLEAVPDILNAQAIVIADTVLAGGRPGDIHRLTIRPDDQLPSPGSLHDCGPLAALAVARQLGWRGSATVVGVEPLTLDGEGLSSAVNDVIPAFAAAIGGSLGATQEGQTGVPPADY